MKNLFSWNNPVMRFLGTMADLMLLNLMWIVFSLPVITAGAATVALQFACLKIVHGEERPIHDFWRSFRTNFKQATCAWLIVLVAATLILAAGYCLWVFEFTGKSFFTLVFIVHAVLFLNFSGFLFPVIAQFENTTINMFKNAFILSVLNIKTALLTTVLSLIPVAWMCVWLETFLRFGFIWICIGFSAIAFLNVIRIDRVFKRSMLVIEDDHMD